MFEFSEDILNETAFQLLASSTISRYAKETIRIARFLDLDLKDNPGLIDEVLERAWDSLKKVRDSDGRGIQEMSLALCLALLEPLNHKEALEVIVATANLKNNAGTWPKHFARYLIAIGPDGPHEEN